MSSGQTVEFKEKLEILLCITVVVCIDVDIVMICMTALSYFITVIDDFISMSCMFGLLRYRSQARDGLCDHTRL